jgi:hypothetical protein
MRLPTLATLLTTAFLMPASAQAPGDLKAGTSIPGPFRVFVASDTRTPEKDANNRTGKIHCFVCEAELNPAIAVFARTVPNAESPAVKLAGKLNELVTKYKSDRLFAFVAFLTLTKEYQEEEGRDAKAQAGKDVAAQAKATGVPFGLAAGKSAATDLYGLKESDDLTIVFFHRMKVVGKWTFSADKPPTDDDARAIAAAVAKELGR